MSLKVSIIGGSGYTGGELLRILLSHSQVEVMQITSERLSGRPIVQVHPNLRGKTNLLFSSVSDIRKCDLIFSALPHSVCMGKFDKLRKLSPKIIDLSADFRLRDAKIFEEWYEKTHSKPEMLKQFVYGLPELHRKEIKKANHVSGVGCNASTTILGLYPLVKEDVIDLDSPIVAEAKVGSSEGGNKESASSHHPERSGCVRSFKPTGHRHSAEIQQELGVKNINLSVTSIEMVRGILVTSHVFLKGELSEKDIFMIYRKYYGDEPFIRIVKDKKGIYRYPEPKILAGTNYCDIGFEIDLKSRRLVVISALDNLMKGASGSAVQCMNLMSGFKETQGLEFTGLHPV